MSVFASRDIVNIFSRIKIPIAKLKKIVIKINMVSPYVILSMTPKDIIDALLRHIRESGFQGEILIAEGSAGDTWDGFQNGGFVEIAKKYDVELFNIHDDDSIEIPVFDSRFEEFYIPISKTLVYSEFLISACRAKTHDTVIVTLSIKNVAVGGIVGIKNRPKIHQGYKAINLNIALLGAIMYPDLAIVDGRIGMEGNGPVSGNSKHWGWIFTGSNPLEVDCIVTYGMGFNPHDVGYLYYLSKLGFGKLENIQLEGADFSEIQTSFKPHVTYKEQLKWKIDPELESELLKKILKIISKFPRPRNFLSISH